MIDGKQKDSVIERTAWVTPADYIPPATRKSYDGRILIDPFLYAAIDARCPTWNIGADVKNEWMARFIVKAKELAIGRQLTGWNGLNDFDYDMCAEYADMILSGNEIGQVEIITHEDVF